MKYLRKYNLHSEYETDDSKNELECDSVSYCVIEDEVHFVDYIDPYTEILKMLNGYEVVDRGLTADN